MKIHKEGYLILFVTTLVLLGLNYFVHYFFPQPEYVAQIFGILSIIFFVLVLQFFRNPNRYTQIDENHVIAPADGKVVVIEEVMETEFFNEKRLQVSIFMSPLNVHINRNPISGIVKYYRYHPGKYLVAWHPKASTDNERTTTVIEAKDKTQVLFRQIAGALARRIVCYLQEGQPVVQGKEMGFIKFGSRVDVYLPLTAKVKVSLNQVVTGGESIIAELS